MVPKLTVTKMMDHTDLQNKNEIDKLRETAAVPLKIKLIKIYNEESEIIMHSDCSDCESGYDEKEKKAAQTVAPNKPVSGKGQTSSKDSSKILRKKSLVVSGKEETPVPMPKVVAKRHTLKTEQRKNERVLAKIVHAKEYNEDILLQEFRVAHKDMNVEFNTASKNNNSTASKKTISTASRKNISTTATSQYLSELSREDESIKGMEFLMIWGGIFIVAVVAFLMLGGSKTFN